MKTATIQLVVVALAGAMAVAQEVPAPPATPATPAAPQAAPAPPARPARPKIARPARPARPVVVTSRRAYLGVDIDAVTPERAAALKMKQAHGVEITMVDQDAPAGKAGLKEHDVIVSYNGKPVSDEDELREMIRDTSPGTAVALGIVRDGQNMTVNVKLAQARQVYSYAGRDIPMVIPDIKVHIPDIEIPSFVMLQYSRRNGLMVENLSPQLGTFFGVPNGEGVLVRSVEKGSAAETAGLRAGDVIVRAGSERVLEMSDWNRIVGEHASGTLPVTVVRDKREQTISLNIPARSSESSTIVVPAPDMERLRAELDRMGPEWQHNQALMAQRLQREIQLHQREWRQEMEKAQRELQRSLRQMQRDMERERKEKNDDQN
jgi:serine protease Do